MPLRTRPAALPLPIALALVAACANPQAPAPEPLAVTERRVAPVTVNIAITSWTSDHIVWVPQDAAAMSDRIMLLLPGTGGAPQHGRLVGSVAASLGYRAIGLMYPNDVAIMSVCDTDPDESCMASMRSEIIEGGDRSPYATVDPRNSIDGRLADLLRWLHDEYPAEEWSDFLLPDGSPRWDRIAVSGLSQGGGHAAYIAKLRAVPRVVMFGAPADGIGGAPAPWMQLGATPAERYFGFRHQRDPWVSISPNWQALGLESFGAPVVIDADLTPSGGSHLFITDLLPATGTYGHAHPSVFVDVTTPKDADGKPLFDALWRHLFGRP